jgi:hypothetical protein
MHYGARKLQPNPGAVRHNIALSHIWLKLQLVVDAFYIMQHIFVQCLGRIHQTLLSVDL